MKVAKLKLSSKYKNELISALKSSMSFNSDDYENISPDMHVIAREQYYLRNNSNQTNMVVIKLDSDSMYIDIIGAGAGTGLFQITYGSEDSFLRKTKELIEQFCKEHRASVEYLD